MMHYKQYSLLLLAALTYFTTAIAQPRIKDQGVIGGNNTDQFSSLYLTKDGGLIAGGASYSNISGQKTQNNLGANDYWIVKLDSNRKIQWDKTLGGNGFDELDVILQTADGGYILGGSSSSDKSIDKTENSRGIYDYWIVKLDTDGNIQWDKTIGGNDNDILRDLRQTSDGGYILGGYSYSDQSGEKTENSRGRFSSDYWVVKLDAAGAVQWDKTIGGNYWDLLMALQQTTDGGYILGGESNSDLSGEKTAAGRGDYDYWIVKLNSNGVIEWDKTIGGSARDELYALRQTTDGGYIMGGESYSGVSGEKTGKSKGSSDYWIVKLDSSANIQWDKTIGGNNIDALTSLQPTSKGGYILGGSSYSNMSGDKTENSRGGPDYWIVKINNNGKVQWDKTVGGNGTERLGAVQEISTNDYVLGGYSYSGISGDKTGGNRGRSLTTTDYWLVELKYDKPGNVAITQVQNSRLTTPQQSSTTFSVYPNPVTTVLYIQNASKTTFILSDQSGKIMLSKTVEGNGNINVADIPAGTYYLINTVTKIAQKVVIIK